ncbi:MAG: energy-coupling factor ABC transporter ATP-binding protein [Lachnospiraceae bacterium]|nr:energy-coupling factor ABC transporter ATP-binding protein [Lachnospiraceae bacterium]
MISLKDVSFTYESQEKKAMDENNPGTVSNMNLEFKKGDFVVITGESGCGKSTVNRLINGLAPNFYQGTRKGTVTIWGQDPKQCEIYETARIVGSVFQNPRTQFFNVDTTSEVAFACENQGLEKEEIMNRVKRTVESFHIEKLMNRSIFQLSGGEKQKIACACVATANTPVVVLDEPSSNLDINAIEDLRRILQLWKSQGKTIVVAEHRLYYLKDLADQLLILKNGELQKSFGKEEIKCINDKTTGKLGLRSISMEAVFKQKVQEKKEECKDALMIKKLVFSYKDSHQGVHIENVSFGKGRITAVVGHNGAGKSTLAKGVCGILPKCKSEIYFDGKKIKNKELVKKGFLVMQDVNTQLFSDSVKNEILLSLQDKFGKKGSREEMDREAMEILKAMDIDQLEERHPISLSGGQKQRVAIASALAADKEILIFDEPTSGLDLKHMKEVSGALTKLSEMGKVVIVITHDPELILSTADDVLCLSQGAVKEFYHLNDDTKEKLKHYFI